MTQQLRAGSCARRGDRRGDGDRAAADDPARARPRFRLWLWRHPDRARAQRACPAIPQKFLPIYEGAAQQYGLGSDGWAYLAALNYAESSFGTDNGPGTGVLSGSNYAGAAGPMQIGIGGAATDNWSTIVAQIPPNLPGGTQPPSVYNEVDAVYGAAILLKTPGARPATGRPRSSAGTTTRPKSRKSPSSSPNTPNRPRQRRRPGQHDVDCAGPGRRAGVRSGERSDHAGRGRQGPAQRTGGDPAGRAASGAGDDRRRQPDHPLPLQLGRRPRARVDARPARPGRRPRGAGERRPRLRLLLGRELRAVGRRPRPKPARKARSPPPGRSRTKGSQVAGSGSRSTPAPPPGRGTRSSRSPGSCSTPSTAHPPPPPAPARAGNPPPRSPTSSPAARSSPATPKAYDPHAPAPDPARLPAGPRRLRQLDTPQPAGRHVSCLDDGRASAQETAAALFAAAYVRFLDGAGTAAALPDATPAVRALAGQAGPVPASRRRGTLVLAQLRPTQRPGASYFVAAHDQAHTFYAQITLSQDARPMGRRPAHAAGLRAGTRAGGPAGAGAAPRIRGARDRRPPVPAGLPALALRAGAPARDRGRHDRLAGRPEEPSAADPARDALAPRHRRGDRDATPRQRLAGAPERHRRPRDLRARPHAHADAWPLAGQRRQEPAMNNRPIDPSRR